MWNSKANYKFKIYFFKSTNTTINQRTLTTSLHLHQLWSWSSTFQPPSPTLIMIINLSITTIMNQIHLPWPTHSRTKFFVTTATTFHHHISPLHQKCVEHIQKLIWKRTFINTVSNSSNQVCLIMICRCCVLMVSYLCKICANNRNLLHRYPFVKLVIVFSIYSLLIFLWSLTMLLMLMGRMLIQMTCLYGIKTWIIMWLTKMIGRTRWK